MTAKKAKTAKRPTANQCENRRYENTAEQCEEDASKKVLVTGRHFKEDGSGEVESREVEVFRLCDAHAQAVAADYGAKNIAHRVVGL